jgi:hypothetical protein
MTMALTLVETRSVTSGNLYRVKQAITTPTHISTSIFVFNTATAEYSHVAMVYDMETVASTSKAAAEIAGEDTYRLAEVTKDWDSLTTASEFSAYNKLRIQALLDEYEVFSASFSGVTTTVYTSH